MATEQQPRTPRCPQTTEVPLATRKAGTPDVAIRDLDVQHDQSVRGGFTSNGVVLYDIDR